MTYNDNIEDVVIMKNKNGFTLIELLAVIAIMGLLIGIAIPGTLNIANKIKGRMYENKIKNIELAVDHYLEDYKSNCDYIDILKGDLTIKNLVDHNYLKPDNESEVKNPVNDDNWYEKNTKVIDLIKDPAKLSELSAEKAIDLEEKCKIINENKTQEKNQIPGESNSESSTHNLLYNKILENKIVNTSVDKVPDLKESLPHGIFHKKGDKDSNGLYGAYDWNDEPTYYFRGNIDNNYVMFDRNDTYGKKHFSYVYNIKDKINDKWLEFKNKALAESDCHMNWYKYGYKSIDCSIVTTTKTTTEEKPMVWRIVRINGDGTIRLVLDDSIGNYIYDNKTPLFATVENATIGPSNILTSSYDKNLKKFKNTSTYNTTNSFIKTTLEDWYSENLDQYDNYLDYGIFISDLIGTGIDNIYNGYNTSLVRKAYSDFYGHDHQIKPELAGIYKLKIGLLTIEELLMAGVGESLEESVYHSYYDLAGDFKNKEIVKVNNYLNNSTGMTMSPFDNENIYMFKPAEIQNKSRRRFGYSDDEQADPIQCEETDMYKEHDDFYCGIVGGDQEGDVPEDEVPPELTDFIGKDAYNYYYIDVTHYDITNIKDEIGVSPVINLKKDIKVKLGKGTKNDPYILNLN